AQKMASAFWPQATTHKPLAQGSASISKPSPAIKRALRRPFCIFATRVALTQQSRHAAIVM
ncbi:hypothetical protein, partial [Craterilacuibacter sp.]|uniref:hypothetical protein n=1 Tax=Craterilacuibacter sp. TaxID=2870909 RepID=UPI003F30C581